MDIWLRILFSSGSVVSRIFTSENEGKVPPEKVLIKSCPNISPQ
jgi:hypothetical protein